MHTAHHSYESASLFLCEKRRCGSALPRGVPITGVNDGPECSAAP